MNHTAALLAQSPHCNSKQLEYSAKTMTSSSNSNRKTAHRVELHLRAVHSLEELHVPLHINIPDNQTHICHVQPAAWLSI
jgi:hypothetical protein